MDERIKMRAFKSLDQLKAIDESMKNVQQEFETWKESGSIYSFCSLQSDLSELKDGLERFERTLK